MVIFVLLICLLHVDKGTLYPIFRFVVVCKLCYLRKSRFNEIFISRGHIVYGSKKYHYCPLNLRNN